MYNRDMGFCPPATEIKEPKPKTTPLDIGGAVVAHEKHSTISEDVGFANKDQGFLGVFDGVGGSVGGRTASEIAYKSITDNLENLPSKLSPEEISDHIEETLYRANKEILAKTANNPEKKGMGTTASVVKIWESPDGQEHKAIIGHIGDSRVYLLRQGRLEQITLDDNFATQWAGDEQKARKLQDRLNNVTSEKDLDNDTSVPYHHRNQIFQSLGTEGIGPHMYIIDLQPGDRLIATTDGITDNLTDQQIREILNGTTDNSATAQALVEKAQKISKDQENFRHKPDDMTAVIASIGAQQPGRVVKQTKSGLPTQPGSQTKPVKPATPPMNQETHYQPTANPDINQGEQKDDNESGWKLSDVDWETGQVIVVKGPITKIINGQLKELINANREHLEIFTQKATDLTHILKFLSLAERIKSSTGGEFTTRELESRIIGAINSNDEDREEAINRITHTGGLRDWVRNYVKSKRN